MGWELRKNVAVSESFPEPEETVTSPSRGIWMRAYFMLRDILTPAIQEDLLQDYPANYFSGKISCSAYKSSLGGGIQILYSPKFMRLLLARHINGFYIYSLEKLII